MVKITENNDNSVLERQIWQPVLADQVVLNLVQVM